MRILICDDHSLFSEAFASLLLQRGHDVVRCVTTPAEALVAGRQLRPEVYLLDLHFPGVHGVDAVKLLRAAIADAPIVVLTAEADAELLRQALDAGADGVVLKSEGVEEIEQVLRRVQLVPPGGHRTRASADKIWSRQARALAQRQARIVEDRNLTPRERQVIVLLVQGKSTAAIASVMNVGKATLHAHLQHLFVKLGVHSRLELVAYAIRRGIVHMDSYDKEVEVDLPQSAATPSSPAESQSQSAATPTSPTESLSQSAAAPSSPTECLSQSAATPSSPTESAFERTTNRRRNLVQTTVGSDPSSAPQWRA